MLSSLPLSGSAGQVVPSWLVCLTASCNATQRRCSIPKSLCKLKGTEGFFVDGIPLRCSVDTWPRTFLSDERVVMVPGTTDSDRENTKYAVTSTLKHHTSWMALQVSWSMERPRRTSRRHGIRGPSILSESLVLTPSLSEPKTCKSVLDT
ncbi:hypothetical protein BKA93DRAFT_597536 [Sparassis latifolia]